MSRENRVVTVTINPAIDQTLAIPNFTAGAVNRVQSSRLDPGGKGVNVASFLSDFGQPAIVTGFLGSDNDGIFRRFFAQKGIEDRFVRIHGETRTGVKIVDDVLRQTTDVNFPGQTPTDEDIERLFEILVELAADHEWFVLAGSIPAGVSTDIYREMVTVLAGKLVVLDTSGDGLRQATAAGPYLIKPNVVELQELIGEHASAPSDVLRYARALMEQYRIGSVVVSMGKEGAVFVEGGDAIMAEPPSVEVESTVGAGDAMVAGLVAGKIRGLPLAECARLATAFSVTAISRIGSGLPSVEAVQAAMDLVTLSELSSTVR
jgi:1-phosphofructokinase